MADDDDPIAEEKRALFGDNAELARDEVVGSGISETKRISLNIMNDLGRLESMPPPWTENRDMIVKLFTPHYQASFQCPGRNQPQCCQAEGEALCLPNWQEREDPEWYAQRINMLLSQVSRRILQDGPLVAALAADEAFELGCFFSEALIKFRWDKHAKRGRKTLKSATRGGEARRKRPSVAVTVAAVDALIAKGKSITRAYAAIAQRQGVTARTIANDYRSEKKQG